MSILRLYLTPLSFLLVFVLAGCATNIPQAVQQELEQAPTVSQVQMTADQHMGRDVRWGGEIIFLANGSASTDIAVLATTLGSKGKPDTDGVLDARFIARIPGFLDPVEYAEGLRITVTGVVTGVDTRMVGEYAYSYPLVEVQAYHLWPKETPRTSNYYRDPFYDPWPWYGYGSWRRHPYWW